ncbi:hypothetical protein D3C72_2057450 [compost metagenome]
MVHRVERQDAALALDPSSDQGRIQLRRQQLAPAAISARARQVVDDELHRDFRGQGAVTERSAIAQLQPGGPVGEGAAVAAHGIRCGTGGNERFGGVAGAFAEPIQRQRGI